jgi:hypothetical protein
MLAAAFGTQQLAIFDPKPVILDPKNGRPPAASASRTHHPSDPHD